MYRKYLRKMDILLLLLHVASTKSVRYFGFHPNMTEREAYDCNTHMFTEILGIGSKVSELRETARTELTNACGRLPFGRKAEEYLDQMFRQIYFRDK